MRMQWKKCSVPERHKKIKLLYFKQNGFQMWFEFCQRNWVVMQISRESITGSRCRKWKTSTTNVHSFTSRNKKLASRGRSEPETSLNCTNRNTMSCKIIWCQSVQALVCHDTQFICYSLWESEPVQLFFHAVRDARMTRKQQDESSCRFQNGLQSSDRLNWRSSKHAVTIIEAAVYHWTHQSVCRIDSQRTSHQL